MHRLLMDKPNKTGLIHNETQRSPLPKIKRIRFGFSITFSAVLVLLLIVAPLSLSTRAQNGGLNVVATTTIIADIAHNIGGEFASVTSIIPREADTHSYTPTPGDVARIVDAQVVLVNGALLEESLLEIIEANASVEPVVVFSGAAVLAGGHEHAEDEIHADGDESDDETSEAHAAAEVIGILGENVLCEEAHDDEREEEGEAHEHRSCDPHFWSDPVNAVIAAHNIAQAFATADPDHAQAYRDAAAAYTEQLEALHAEIEALVETVPPENRVIVTSHEFLAYFAHAYGFEIVGTVIPGISTLAEVSPEDIIDLVAAIEAEGVRAIFVEISAGSRLAETVAAEAGYDVQVVVLYSESLSAPDGPAATYIDYMRFNTAAITGALVADE